MVLLPMEIDDSALAIFRNSVVFHQFNLIPYSKRCSFETALGFDLDAVLFLCVQEFAIILHLLCSASRHTTHTEDMEVLNTSSILNWELLCCL
jgi:hypothetical protein